MKSKNRELFKTNSLRLQAADLQLITYNLENLYEFNIEYEFPARQRKWLASRTITSSRISVTTTGRLPGLVAQRKSCIPVPAAYRRNIFLREVDDGPSMRGPYPSSGAILIVFFSPRLMPGMAASKPFIICPAPTVNSGVPVLQKNRIVPHLPVYRCSAPHHIS